MRHSSWKILACLIPYIINVTADVVHPILWERSFHMNISDPTSSGQIDQSTSFMVTSEDFQGVLVDNNSDDPPERVVLNFGESCLSSNTTLQTLQELNANTIETRSMQNAQKLALVKRGNCTWSEKISVVNNLALLNNINVTAVFIYDNQSYGDAIIITKTSLNGSGTLDVPQYATPLPAYRSVLNMSDNDLTSSNSPIQTVYFLPNTYGETFVSRLNAMTNPNDPNIKTFWLLTPYLSAVSWGSYYNSGFFGLNTSYIAYIVSFVGVLIILVIMFRWWSRRQIRNDASVSPEGVVLRPTSSKLDPLPVDIVNKLPVDRYSPELIKNENCAICLEDFKPGKDDVRLLPCGHGFCVLCIDPWLTQKSCLCPMCKWDCLPTDLREQRELQKRQSRNIQQEPDTSNEHTDSHSAHDSEPGPSTSPRNSHIETNDHTEEHSLSADENTDSNEHETTSNHPPEISITMPDDEQEKEIPHVSHTQESSSSAPEFTVIDLSSQDTTENNDKQKK